MFESHYIFKGPRYRCAYCNDPADTIDHTTPVWFVDGNSGLVRQYFLIKVSACFSCNSMAGAVVDRTWAERKGRIASRLEQKNKTLLKTPVRWRSKDKQHVGGNLWRLINQLQHQADHLRERLLVLADIEFPPDMPVDLQILKPGAIAEFPPENPAIP